MSRNRNEDKDRKPPPPPKEDPKEKKSEERTESQKYEAAQKTTEQAEQTFKSKAESFGKEELAESTRFETYIDIGGDRMYRRMEGGKVAEKFTEEEIEEFLSENQEYVGAAPEPNELEESQSLERQRARRDSINSAQATVQVSPTESLASDGFYVDTFIVVVDGQATTRSFLVR